MPNAEQVAKNKAEVPKATARGVAEDWKEFEKLDSLLDKRMPGVPPQLWSLFMLFVLLKKRVITIAEIESAGVYSAQKIREAIEAPKIVGADGQPVNTKSIIKPVIVKRNQ